MQIISNKRKLSEVTNSSSNSSSNSNSNGTTEGASISKQAKLNTHKTDAVEEKVVSEQHKEEEKEEEEADEEEEDSDGDEDEQSAHANTKVQLTSQDIQIARETVELFKSNVFKLQIDELLEQVQLKESSIIKVERFLHKLYDLIQEIPEWGVDKSLEEVESFFKDKIVSVPFADPKPQASTTKFKFGYLKPTVSLVGSFALKSAIYQPNGSCIDVALQMPSVLFDKKDYLNFRAFHKKSVYLAYLTHHLNILFEKYNMDNFIQLHYKYLHNDSLQTVLQISCSNPKTDNQTSSSPLTEKLNFFKTKFKINLIVTLPENVFDNKKLLPHKNCIRVQNDNTTPTPLYNFALLASTTSEHYLKYLHKSKKMTEAYKEASVLGRLWLHQRGFSSNISQSGSLAGFGSFEFCVLMSALLNGGGENGNKILLHGFSSYQLFKGIIKYLATMDLCSTGYLQFQSFADQSDKNSQSSNTNSKYVKEGFNVPTIFDKSTKINVLSKLTPSAYAILKLYAQETLQMLDNVVKDQFENIFLINLQKSNILKYDYEIDLSLSNTLSTLYEGFDPKERVTSMTFENYVVKKISQLIETALADRINGFELDVISESKASDIDSKRSSLFPIAKRRLNKKVLGLKIKLLVNPMESEKLVTRGPTNEESAEKIALFKKFWGPKASLRRFKDGTIVHSCVWSSSSSQSVVLTILKYILKQQLHGDDNMFHAIGMTKFQKLLPLPNVPGSATMSILNLNNYHALKKSFDELNKIIFQMSLPLSVKSVFPIGNAFRYTSLCQPVPFAYSNPDFLQDVVLEFENSAKWPDEISSLEKAKTAFLLKIHDKVSESYAEYSSYFTRDESIPNNLDIITLNILTPEGFGFRFRVLTERDEVLYLRAIGNARNELKPELERTFFKFSAKYQAAIRHSRTLEMISHSYPLYSPTVRLFKKWLDSHLLLSHFPEELVELLAIKPFVENDPFHVPGSLQNGFMKVLKFLSSWNWLEDPLIMDLVKNESFTDMDGANNEISSTTLKNLSERLTFAQYKDIQSNFETMRKSDPNGLNIQFFVASKNDPSGILYTNGIPLAISTRLTALAKVAMNFVSVHGLNEKTINLLFSPGLKDYDFVCKIKLEESLKLSSGCAGEFKNLDQTATKFPSNVNDLSTKMDPTHHLVKYLNKKYSNFIIFSSHKYVAATSENGDVNVITGLIKPFFKSNQQKFRVNMDCDVKPVDEQNVQLNKEAVLNEIAIFGGDLITEIQVNN